MQITDYKIIKKENQNTYVTIYFNDDGIEFSGSFSFEDLENLTVGLQDILLELFNECRKK